MKAIVFTQKNVVSIQELPDPHPSDDEVVVKVHASGICHTDIEVLRDNYGSSAFPVVPGHEYAGTIIEVGSKVKDIRVGDRVVVDPNFECGKCRSCQKGWTHLCKNLKAYGVTIMEDSLKKAWLRALLCILLVTCLLKSRHWQNLWLAY